MKKWKCTICNYIHTGDEPPEICPVCGADKSYFVEVTDEVEQSAEAVDLEKDRTGRTEISSGQKWKCTVCSYIHPEEELPEMCPQCAAGKNFFVKVPVEKEIEPVKEEKAEAKREEKPPVSEQPEQFGLAGRLIVRHHLHPISVHTPNGVYPVAIILLVLAVVFGSEVLEKASYFNFIAVFLSMPAVFFTGLVAWKLKYRAAKTWIFRTKLVCGALVTVFVSLLVFWRFIDNGIAFSEGVGGSIYLGLSLVTLATIGLAGHLGGKLVFKK